MPEDRFVVLTVGYDANGQRQFDTRSLSGFGVTHDRLDAIRLRDAYIVTLAAGSDHGVGVKPLIGTMTGYVVTFPDGSREHVTVELCAS